MRAALPWKVPERMSQSKECNMWRSIARQILLPFGTVAIAGTIEVLLEAALHRHQLVLTPSLAAVVVSTLYGGLTAGVIAIFLSIGLMDLIYVAPGFSMREEAIDDIVQLLIFLMVALFVSSLSKEKIWRLKAEARSKAKDDLLREVAHELRTPMSSILGWTQILRLRPDGENLTRACEVIERNAKMQMILVEDLLDVARILTGRLHLTHAPVNLRHVVETAVSIVEPTAAAKAIQIGVRMPEGTTSALVEGDERRLLQVFWNLLTNAIKFTPEKGSVHIAMDLAENSAVIEVKDNGVGIKPEDLRCIFEKGTQGEQAHLAGGLGLGLWLAKSLVQVHGGDIDVASTEGKGSTFSVRLPLIQPKETPVPRSQLQAY
jgi:signal transduction histidine kinase